MRIGINTFALSSRLGLAGSGRYIAGLIGGLAALDSGHDLVIFGNADNRRLLAEDRGRFVDCGRVTTVRPLRLIWEQVALPIMARRFKIDVLHSPVFVAPLALRRASVVTILDMTWFTLSAQHTRTKGAYFRAMIPPSVRRAGRVIAISEASGRDVIDLLGTPPEKMVVTHLGVDLARFCPEAAREQQAVAARYGVRPPYVLYVGKLEPRKNLPVLIEAFASIARQCPDHQLVVAGNPGWGYEAIYNAATRSSCRERIRFAGFVRDEDLPALYAGADLFVYPSSYEGFGFPVLEAMACGTPAITSSVSSLPEVAGDAAMLVGPTDVEALAAAMRRALTDSPLRESMRAAGLKQARRFTWEQTARQTLEVYEQAHVLAQHS